MTDQLTLAVGDNGGLDIHKIRECVAYSPLSPTGLVWIKSSGRVKAGDHAGSYNGARGYYYVTINKKKYLAHRVVWVLMHGALGSSVDVDHKDGNTTKNKLAKNCGWQGRIWDNGKIHRKFSTSRGVVEAWLIEMRESLHGEFARHE